MTNDVLTKHVEKVNKILLILSWIIIILISSPYIIDSKFTIASKYQITIEFIGVLIPTILFYLKKNGYLIAAVLCFSKFIAIYSTSLTKTGPNLGIIELIYLFVIVCYAALYLNHKFIIAGIAIYDIASITLYLVTNLASLSQFVITFVILNVCMILLFFVTKCGNELIKNSSKNEANSEKVSNNLKTIINSLGKNTLNLHKDISAGMGNLDLTKKSSKELTATVQEVANGVANQAESISQINEMINDADIKLNKTVEFSNHMSSVSKQSLLMK